ncbi:MAG: hypothetical protein AAF587_43655 [Bacteroidota bacterium]
MKSLYVSLVFIISCLLATTGFAQDPLYKGIKIVDKKLSPEKAVYHLKKWDIDFKVSLSKTPTAVNIRIFGPKESLIGIGKIGKEGTKARKLVMQKSAKGIISLWQFAMDRVMINNGNLVLVGMLKEGSQLWTCQYCCYETHLQGTAYTDGQYVAEQIKKGKPPKDWGWIYDLPPSDAREAFTDCVDACLSGEECSDYEW